MLPMCRWGIVRGHQHLATLEQCDNCLGGNLPHRDRYRSGSRHSWWMSRMYLRAYSFSVRCRRVPSRIIFDVFSLCETAGPRSKAARIPWTLACSSGGSGHCIRRSVDELQIVDFMACTLLRLKRVLFVTGDFRGSRDLRAANPPRPVDLVAIRPIRYPSAGSLF